MIHGRPRNLQEVLDSVPSTVDHLYNNPTGARAFPVVPGEFTNWRDEQHAWRESVALFDLSHHMSDLYVYGPDAFRLLEHLAINSFRNFRPGMAKHFVACTPQGYVVGDAVLFYLEPEVFQLVGRPSALNWVQHHGETGAGASGSSGTSGPWRTPRVRGKCTATSCRGPKLRRFWRSSTVGRSLR